MIGKKALVLTLMLLFLVSATATVPRLMTVQGRLKESGSAVTGNYNITFYIYNAETDGSPLYTEAHTGANSVPVSGGFFSVVLGDISVLNLPFKEQYWLALKVGSDAEMSPRIKLTNASYAFVARDLNVSDNLNIDGGTLYVDIANNRVGIGTISPQQVFEVVGNAVRVSGVTTPMLELYPSTGDEWRVQSQNDSSFSVFNVTDGRTYLTINGSGNIGVEKTPSYKFDVNGIVNATQYYQAGSPLISGYWTQSGNDIYYNTGNVGIGTTSPGSLLDVNGQATINGGSSVSLLLKGSSHPLYAYDGSDNVIARITSAGHLILRPNSSTDTVDISPSGNSYFNGGNVGIGTTSPGQKLTVAGTVESTSGGFKFPDATTQTTAATGGSIAAKVVADSSDNSVLCSLNCGSGYVIIIMGQGATSSCNNYTDIWNGSCNWNQYVPDACIGQQSCTCGGDYSVGDTGVAVCVGVV